MNRLKFPSNVQNISILAASILTVGQDALFHGETLFVISASDAKEVSFPFIAELVGFNFSTDAFLIE